MSLPQCKRCQDAVVLSTLTGLCGICYDDVQTEREEEHQKQIRQESLCHIENLKHCLETAEAEKRNAKNRDEYQKAIRWIDFLKKQLKQAEDESFRVYSSPIGV